MRGRVLCILIASVIAAASARGAAHHSFSAEYDGTKELTFTGTVTKVEWLNPHTRFYVDVKDDSGKVTNWEFELASPNQLARRGWTRNSLQIGDMVTVAGYAAKDGFHLANARTVSLADGRKVFVGSAGDGGPEK